VINCKIIPVTSPAIEKGALVIRDGLIESIGAVEKIKIPDDAEVIDGQGLVAYPGLISAHTGLFLEARQEPRPEEETARPAGGAQPPAQTSRNADVLAVKLIKPKLSVVESYHRLGITTVLVGPTTGIFAGQSVLLNLNGETAEDMVVRQPVALHIQFVTERNAYPSSLMGTMAFIRQAFLDTAYYEARRAQFAKVQRGMKRPEYNPFWEALVPYVVDKKPVVFTCNSQEDIKRALRLRDEFKLNAWLSGANEAWRVTDVLKKSALPLLVTLDFRPPLSSEFSQKGEEARKKAEAEIYPGNPRALSKAGVKFALTTLGLNETSAILKNIKDAIKGGLPKDEVLKAMTITPAQYLGVDPLLGSLEPGKIANVVLARGELFEEKTEVEKVLVDGLLFKLEKPPVAERATTPSAANLSGSWKASLKSPMGDMEVTLDLEHDGNRVSGSIGSQMGKWEIRDGVLRGADLTFTIVATMMNDTVEMAFSGKAEKDKIEGTISSPMGSAELRAARTPKSDETRRPL
jgi:imidazolonepropionase-like amidohydrolase